MANDAPEAQVFSYKMPEVSAAKGLIRLARSSNVGAIVQVLNGGGENNLHAHAGMDSVYMVLSGRVRFYGEGDALMGDLSTHDGVLIPHGCKYWFESVGDEPLELLQVTSPVPNVENKRLDFSPVKSATASAQWFDAGKPGETPVTDSSAVGLSPVK